MTNLANESGAINLSQGFPDFDVPPELIERVAAHMRAGRNQYAPMPGVMELRCAISEKVQHLYGKTYDPESEITMTAGATEAVFSAITACVHPGDEVIIFEPAYDAYLPAILLSGGKPVYVALEYPKYTIDWNRVRDAITDKTRLLIFNSPHNPTGAVLSTQDLHTLIELIADTRALIVSDEVYEHIIFDNIRHESMSRYPELTERSFVISSFGKTYHATGWKMGYCLAPVGLSQEFQKVHQYLTFACNTPIQYAFADIMKDASRYLNLSRFYQAKRDTFLKLVEKSRFRALPCRGTYFQMLDFSNITDEADVDFAKRLTIDYGVAAIPPSVFYHRNTDHQVLRFCFAKKDDTLKEAAERLCRI